MGRMKCYALETREHLVRPWEPNDVGHGKKHTHRRKKRRNPLTKSSRKKNRGK